MEFGDRPAFFLVADDAAGGYFAINYGNFRTDLDSIYYLSPDDLAWQSLGMNYEDFIWFCFTGDLKRFYSGIRWTTWQKDIQTLKSRRSVSDLSPLWSKEERHRKDIKTLCLPKKKLFLYHTIAQTIELDKNGNQHAA